MPKPCAYCDRDYEPANWQQRFCSKSCAGHYRQALHPTPRREGSRRWHKTAEQNATYDSSEYRRARDLVIAAALARGAACPDCGVALTKANATADHIIERSRGGPNTVANMRCICGPCNHRRGSALGGRVTSARKRAAQHHWQ